MRLQVNAEVSRDPIPERLVEKCRGCHSISVFLKGVCEGCGSAQVAARYTTDLPWPAWAEGTYTPEDIARCGRCPVTRQPHRYFPCDQTLMCEDCKDDFGWTDRPKLVPRLISIGSALLILQGMVGLLAVRVKPALAHGKPYAVALVAVGMALGVVYYVGRRNEWWYGPGQRGW